MKNSVLDTNVLIRYLVGDNKLQHQKAISWFRKAQDQEGKLLLPHLVIAETSFVLESFYQLDRKQIAKKLKIVIKQPWLKIEKRPVLLNLWKYYLQGLHFVDSYLLSMAKYDNLALLSFDQKLNKMLSNDT